MMDITYVDQKLDMSGGGSNFSLELMARMMSESGYNVKILTLKPNQNNLPVNPQFEVIGAERRFGTRIGTLEHAYQTMSAHSADTDLFHVFSPNLLPAAGFFCKQNKKTPVVGRLNTYSMFCVNMDQMDGNCHQNCTVRAKFAHQNATISTRILKLPFYASRTFVEPKLCNALDAYFAISPAVKQIYSEVGLPTDRISVVPNFYDPSFVSATNVSTQNGSSRALKLLYVGRVKPSKGLDCLIKSLNKTNKVELTIVGDGSALSDLRSFVTTLGLNERVSFEGRVPNRRLPLYYRNADLFVHPARWPEPFGRTLLESMQCGTPMLVTDTGGPPWVVGEAGLTFPPGDAEKLAEILSQLERDQSQLETLQDACSNQLENFEPDAVVSSIQQKYTQICDI